MITTTWASLRSSLSVWLGYSWSAKFEEISIEVSGGVGRRKIDRIVISYKRCRRLERVVCCDWKRGGGSSDVRGRLAGNEPGKEF